MALSCAVERMYFEFGENCTCWLRGEISGPLQRRKVKAYHIASWPSAKVLRHWPEVVFHIRLQDSWLENHRPHARDNCDPHETIESTRNDETCISVKMYSSDIV